jgi:hypothetical protein
VVKEKKKTWFTIQSIAKLERNLQNEVYPSTHRQPSFKMFQTERYQNCAKYLHGRVDTDIIYLRHLCVFSMAFPLRQLFMKLSDFFILANFLLDFCLSRLCFPRSVLIQPVTSAFCFWVPRAMILAHGALMCKIPLRIKQGPQGWRH